jgi:dolichyl-phosphate-mannose--protein O-mannosyl transferase
MKDVQYKIIFWSIIFIALFFRLYGLFTGTPYNCNVDEQNIMNSVLHIIYYHNPNPLFLNYPSLLFYLEAIWLFLIWCIGKIFLLFPNFKDFFLGYYADNTQIIVFARLLIACMGVATIYYIMKIGTLIFNRVTGLMAGLILACSFLHSLQSHFVLTDVPATMFVVISFYYAIIATGSNTLKHFILSAIFAGFAASTKYNTGLILIVPIFILFIGQNQNAIFHNIKALWFDIKFRWVIRSSFIAFLLTSPYIVINPV